MNSMSTGLVTGEDLIEPEFNQAYKLITFNTVHCLKHISYAQWSGSSFCPRVRMVRGHYTSHDISFVST
jgi:hypothetical protein